MNQRTFHPVAGLMLAIALGLASARADILLEFDFQNYDAANHQVSASQVRSGASALGYLTTNTADVHATVNIGTPSARGSSIPSCRTATWTCRDGTGAGWS